MAIFIHRLIIIIGTSFIWVPRSNNNTGHLNDALELNLDTSYS